MTEHRSYDYMNQTAIRRKDPLHVCNSSVKLLHFHSFVELISQAMTLSIAFVALYPPPPMHVNLWV